MPTESKASNPREPLTISEQGSFFVGGRIIKAAGSYDPSRFFLPFSSEGQTYAIEHLYAQYQIPPKARQLPIVMVHGGGQTGKSWETTPDGREGFQTIFVRRRFAVYVIDFPGRGRAGIPSFSGPLGNLAGTQVIPAVTVHFGHELSFLAGRLGPKPFEFYPQTQFPKEALGEFLRQSVAGIADDAGVISDAIAALFDRIGPAILVTHSQGGLMGWLAAAKSANVKAIVAYEPFVSCFSEDELPDLPPLSDGSRAPSAEAVSAKEFASIAKIPIQIVWGDNIPKDPHPVVATDVWRLCKMASREFVDRVNRHGGDASILDLPSVGIRGNTHFPFSDLNSLNIADLMSDFLHGKGVD
ncbi:MAG TPA: alpha/beta fold hydrolase [Candidatus Binataceae bacterium]|nr:alpha/beta fold hydrolase [Candidatus Binataceae bacterium]